MVCYVAKNLSRDALCTLKVVYLGRTLESEDKGQRNEGGKRKRRGEEIRAMSVVRYGNLDCRRCRC